ncbi:MAG: ethanolamine ammonia-lyase subunit EutC [Angelakisella sp.]|jgi:ethanolamine ammonia-lyase small subunit|nr:ethanolamine ammonia-lyase subunit EutC [Angelakisella sp.]
MLDAKTIDAIAEEIIAKMRAEGAAPAPEKPSRPQGDAAVPAQPPRPAPQGGANRGEMEDITSAAHKAVPTLQNPADYDALLRMKGRTSARIGVGRCGPRVLTQTMLTLRADHALARDAVFTDVDPAFLEQNGLFSVQTNCPDKNTHITRPDLGRQLSGEAVKTIGEKCQKNPDVQIIVSDGLSSKAIEANVANALPAIVEGLQSRGLTVGTPFFIRFGRVAAEDAVAELLGAKVVCILIGERPGLGTAESMSAYICYGAKVGQPEARRTVVSNIHRGGISSVEAGAYIAELIKKIYDAKASGVELKQ